MYKIKKKRSESNIREAKEAPKNNQTHSFLHKQWLGNEKKMNFFQNGFQIKKSKKCLLKNAKKVCFTFLIIKRNKKKKKLNKPGIIHSAVGVDNLR